MDDTTRLLELIQAVEHMRNMQKSYFKTRDKEILQRSKRAEYDVDKMLDNLHPKQAELF